MSYPSELIRGIPNKDFLIEETQSPSSNLFQFQSIENRDDYKELSINWYDNEDALKVAFEQKKENGEIQFKLGVAILSKDELDKLRKHINFRDCLTYERACLKDNNFHGNILLLKNTNKNLQKQIESSLALLCFLRLEKRTEDK